MGHVFAWRAVGPRPRSVGTCPHATTWEVKTPVLRSPEPTKSGRQKFLRTLSSYCTSILDALALIEDWVAAPRAASGTSASFCILGELIPALTLVQRINRRLAAALHCNAAQISSARARRASQIRDYACDG